MKFTVLILNWIGNTIENSSTYLYQIVLHRTVFHYILQWLCKKKLELATLFLWTKSTWKISWKILNWGKLLMWVHIISGCWLNFSAKFSLEKYLRHPFPIYFCPAHSPQAYVWLSWRGLFSGCCWNKYEYKKTAHKIVKSVLCY